MKSIFTALSVLLLFTQCTPLKLSLPGSGWEQPVEYKVKGKQGLLIKQRLSFAEYTTSVVDRSWIRNEMITSNPDKSFIKINNQPLLSATFTDKSQRLHFSMSGPDSASAEVFCAAKVSAQDFYVGRNPNSLFNIAIDLMGLSGDASSNLYYVEIYQKGQSIPWQFVLDNPSAQKAGKKYTGYLAKDKDNYYKLLPLTELADGKGIARQIPFGLLGFQILTKDDRPLAAVSMMDGGKIYFNTTANKEERFLMATLCSALLVKPDMD